LAQCCFPIPRPQGLDPPESPLHLRCVATTTCPMLPWAYCLTRAPSASRSSVCLAPVPESIAARPTPVCRPFRTEVRSVQQHPTPSLTERIRPECPINPEGPLEPDVSPPEGVVSPVPSPWTWPYSRRNRRRTTVSKVSHPASPSPEGVEADKLCSLPKVRATSRNRKRLLLSTEAPKRHRRARYR
jgi:hypothetical protein